MTKSNSSTEREKLAYELKLKWPWVGVWLLEEFAKFILEDRKRIVEPLVKFRSQPMNGYDFIVKIKALEDACSKTLKNAGIQ